VKKYKRATTMTAVKVMAAKPIMIIHSHSSSILKKISRMFPLIHYMVVVFLNRFVGA
jgi:hypothetical protein